MGKQRVTEQAAAITIPEDAQVYKLYTQNHMPQSTYG